MKVNEEYCFFRLSGLKIEDFMEIVNYKAWTYKSYQRAYNVRYVNIINKLEKGTTTLRTSIGFAPLLIRFLRMKGFDASGEEFRAREVTFPMMLLSLYDFQERMVADWLRAGGIGVIKAPTGSGKTIIGSKAIEEIGRKALILVHTSDLLVNVWIDSLIKSFGSGITYQVGIVGGGVTDKDRITMRIGTRTSNFDENMRKDIVIATFQTLINHLDELRNYKFGLMIVDECIPIDSKIWTQDGVIRYEDLGYGQEYKNDVFQVWSNDKDNNIVNNGYKKVKTRMKHMYRTIVETGDELVCSLDHKVLTRKDDGKEEFVEIEKAKNIGLSLIKPGYRYDENEKRGEITRLFLKYIDRCNKEGRELSNVVTNLWNNKVRGNIIFLDILKYEYRGYEQGYTLTVNNDHNYLVNGFVVKNCHHAPAQMFRKVNSVIKAPYKLGLSATVRRLDGMEKDIFGALGDIQSKVSIRELINKGILAEPRFQSPVIIDQEVMAAIETCGLGGLNLSRFVKKASASSQKKLDYIINICKNIAARGRTFLLFTDYVRAEDVFVRDMYAERLIQEGLSISIVDQGMSSDERSKVFNYLETGKISGIIFGKLGSEGVNIPSVNVVVMANGIKSPITFCQRVGRVMRKVEGKDWCDVYEVLIDIPMEHRWSDFNFAEYRAEGFQKTVYKVD